MFTSTKGFTLIELLLYMAIAVIVLGSLSILLLNLYDARVKTQSITEVDQQAAQVIERIRLVARNAQAITTPTPTNSSASLVLDVVTGANDPTTFDLSSNTLRIQEGVATPIALTNNIVITSGLSFTNLSAPNDTEAIRVSFTLSRINPENRSAFTYTRTYTTTIALRTN